MYSVTSRSAHAFALCAAAVSLCSIGVCQGLGPEAYGMVSRFGMASPTTARQLAMGAPIASLNDVHFANPAFAPVQQHPDAGLQVNTTDHKRGPRITSFQGHYVHPLRPDKDGLQLTVLSLGSSGGQVMLPGMGPAGVDMSEDGLVVDYGRRLGAGVTAGLSVLGYSSSELGFASPGGPALMSLSASSDYGARLGAAYEWRPGGFVGLSYSYSQQTVKASGLLIGAPAQVVFHGDQLAIGVSGYVADEILAVAEYERGTSSSGPLKSSSNAWHLGAEGHVAPNVALRAGLNDGNPTFGVGYDNDRWQVSYAYLGDWNEQAVGALFGGSDTHALHAAYQW